MLAEVYAADCCIIYLVGDPRRLSTRYHNYGGVFSGRDELSSSDRGSCHPERSERSRLRRQTVALTEILRYAQNDRLWWQ